MICKAKVKDAVKGYNISGDFVDVLTLKAVQIIKEACRRAEANGRRTVMSKDL